MPRQLSAHSSVCEAAEPIPEQWGRPVRFSNTQDIAGQEWRYFTLIPCGSTETVLCLVFSVDAVGHWAAGVESVDGGRTFQSDGASLVAPFAFWTHSGEQAVSVSHNLAILRHGATYFIAGGLYARNTSWHKGTGIWLAHGPSWRFAPGDPQADAHLSFKPSAGPTPRGAISEKTPTQWLDVRLAVTGFQPGCVERRRNEVLATRSEGDKMRTACEFDGRLTLVHHRGRFFLYTRLNSARSGHRFVQMTSSVDLRSWSRFVPIAVEGYNSHEEGSGHGNIYFWSASANPLDNGTMVALAPVSHHYRGCLGISLSADGQHWSPITPLVGTALDTAPCEEAERASGACFDGKFVGQRTTHHPVTGVFHLGASVVFFIHENVPKIVDHAPPASRRPSRLMRYAVPASAFLCWTACSRAWLKYRVQSRRSHEDLHDWQARSQRLASTIASPEVCRFEINKRIC